MFFPDLESITGKKKEKRHGINFKILSAYFLVIMISLDKDKSAKTIFG
jgi:hypothetical protein